MITDSGDWYESRATFKDQRIDRQPAVLFAVADRMQDLADNCAAHHVRPDWARVKISLFPGDGGTHVTVGTWCHPTGERIEYGVPILDRDPNQLDSDDIAFLPDDPESWPAGEIFRRFVTPWETETVIEDKEEQS